MKLLICVLALAGMAAGASAQSLCEYGGNGDRFLAKCAPGDETSKHYVGELKRPSDPPRSVPAVRKTRKVCAPNIAQICTEMGCGCADKDMVDELYWTCADPDRALIVSQNGRKAVCLLVESE